MKLSIQSILLILTLLFSVDQVTSQSIKPYHWNNERQLSELTDKEAEIPLYFIELTKKYEYQYDLASGELICYETSHDIIRVNNAEALSSSNQIYISTRNMLELIDLQARFITPSNKIINLDQSNIKEIQDENIGSGYKIFAIEGAVVGGEIEYYYTRKITASYFGSEYFQFTYPVKNYRFELISPHHLEFDFRTYNTKIQVTKIDSVKIKNQYLLTDQNIVGLQEEDFSAHNDSRKHIMFKLAYNTSKDGEKKRLLTWDDAGKRLYDQISVLSKEEEKAFKQFLKKNNFKDADPIVRLKKAEHYIKINYAYNKNMGEEGNSIDYILTNKYGTYKGFTRLYFRLLNELGIQKEIVVTCDRFRQTFDPDFDNWSFLDDFLLYLPTTDQYLSPIGFAYRLGNISNEHTGNYGLFIKEKNMGEYMKPMVYTQKIPTPDYTKNSDDLDIQISFDNTNTSNTIDIRRSFGGDQANIIKANALFMSLSDQQKMYESFFKYFASDAEIDNIKVIEANTDYLSWQKPFIISAQFKTKSYLQKAGNTLLFKIGNVIGPQSEMYQNNERMTPVTNTSNRGYVRNIQLKIPKGYIIQNPNDINLVEQVFESDELIFDFEAFYEMKDEYLNIKIIEFYNRMNYPKEKFEDFRKVINAAADWNKIVLVLKPQQ